MLGNAPSPYDIHFLMFSSNRMGYGDETGNLVACIGTNDFVQVSQYGMP